MNNHDATRVLRIEPLETRSLLAGNLFAGDDLRLNLFGDGTQDNDQRRGADRDQPQQIGASNPTGGQPARNVAAEATSSPAQDSVTRPLPVFLVEPTPEPGPPNFENEPPRPPAPRVSAIDAALAALTTVDATEAVDDAIHDEDLRRGTRQEFQSTGIKQSESLDEFRYRPNSIQLAPIEREPGLIELSPLESGQLGDGLRDDAEPWQLGSDILPKLRSAIERTSHAHDQIVDAAIATWFGGNAGTGGLIAMNQFVLPTATFDTAIQWIDVALQSDLKLHRSLGMIASGATTPLSDVALDAIMASLADVTQSQVQPVKAIHSYEVPPTKIPKLAYPAIAVLTAAAIAARRKHHKEGGKDLVSE